MNARSSRFSLVALLGLALAGCAGGHGGYGAYGGGPNDVTLSGGYNQPAPPPVAYQPAPPPVAAFTTLTVQVTNDSTAVIDVTATTPDETVDAGDVNPGETIQFDLGELPSWTTLSATAVTTDANGAVPSYPDDTVTDGIDYTDANPFVGIDWQDQTVAASSYSTTGSSSAPASSMLIATKVPARSNVRIVTPTRKPRT